MYDVAVGTDLRKTEQALRAGAMVSKSSKLLGYVNYRCVRLSASLRAARRV